MTMARSKDFELLDQLAEEFAERFRRGERPALADYTTRYPELADEIRELFPALVEVEQADADQPSRPTREPAQLMPTQIGDYRVLQEIGRGGMGVVYEAEQKSLGRRVALKVLPRSTTQEARAVERFRREARAAAKLHHTNIVPIFEIGQDGETHFYAMQFIQGQGLDLVLDELRRLRSISLGDGKGSEKRLHSNPHGPPVTDLTQSLVHNRFDDGRPETIDATEIFSGKGRAESTAVQKIPAPASASTAPAFHLPGSEDLSRVEFNRVAFFQSVARIGQQAAAALAHAHARGIVHRDIKPSNLLLDAAGVIWITDFGLAKIDDSNLTHSGDMVGTLRYMAPERFAGKSDPRSDIYGLGLTLYELLALRPAFEANDRLKLIEQIRQLEPPRPRDLDPTVPEELETIVLKAMDKDPERRYPSADALAEDLRRFLANEPILARRVGPVERVMRWCRRNPLVAGLTGAILGLIGVLAVVSTLAALWLNGALDTSEGHRKRAEEAEAAVRVNLADVEQANREKTKQLRESLLHQANAVRWSGRAGRRFECLAALAKAAQIQPSLDLRNEAIASMAMPDLRQVWALDHDPLINTVVAWDANLEHYVVADRKGDVSVRRYSDHREAVRLPGSGPHAVYGKFSPDGRYLAVKYDNQAVVYFAVWDVAKAKEVIRLPQGNTHHAFGFSLDGKRLAVATPDRRVTVHDLETGEVGVTFSTKERVYHLEFDPAGKHVALCLEAAAPIEIRDASTGTVVKRLPSNSRVRCVAFDQAGDRLAAGGDDRNIRVWDLTKPTGPPAVFRGHQGVVTLVHFVPNSDLLVSSGWDRTTRLWDLITGKEQVQKPGTVFHTDRTGRKLAAASPGSGAALWEIAGGDECRVVKGQRLAFDPHSPVAIVGSYQDMSALDLSVHQRPTHFGPNHIILQFHPKERTLVSMPVDGQTGAAWAIAETQDEHGRRYTLGPPRPWKLPVWTQHQSFVLSPDGRTVAVLQRASEPLLLDWETLQTKFTLSPLGGVANLSFRGDGKWIAGGTWQGKNVKVWDVETGRELIELPFPQTAAVMLSPDGQSLAVSHAGETQIWETATWKMTRRIPKKSSDENHVVQAFSPDGTMLAIHTTLGRVLLVNPKTGEELATLEPPNQANPRDVLFDSTGGRVAITNAIGLIHIWDLRAIRRQLKAISLDWDLPEIAAAPWVNQEPRTIGIENGK